MLTALGATYGGSMVFDYGFNVETAGITRVWHRSEFDVLPGHHASPSSVTAAEDGNAEPASAQREKGGS